MAPFMSLYSTKLINIAQSIGIDLLSSLYRDVVDLERAEGVGPSKFLLSCHDDTRSFLWH